METIVNPRVDELIEAVDEVIERNELATPEVVFALTVQLQVQLLDLPLATRRAVLDVLAVVPPDVAGVLTLPMMTALQRACDVEVLS